MKFMLYSIYAGFLLGCYFLGYIVADITTQSTSIVTTSSINATTAAVPSEGDLQTLDITRILSSYIQSTSGVLTFSFILSAIGMAAMAGICIASRDSKIREIDRLLKESRPKTKDPLSEDRIIELEEEILTKFPFKT
jgi:hypothetical protein